MTEVVFSTASESLLPNKLLESVAATPGRWRRGSLLASTVVVVASPEAGALLNNRSVRRQA
jgi:hypothetical protein